MNKLVIGTAMKRLTHDFGLAILVLLSVPFFNSPTVAGERTIAGERISKEMLFKHMVGRTWIGSTRDNAQYIAKINRDGTFYVDVPNRTAESSGSWKIDSKGRYCQDFDAGWSSRCTYFEYIDKLPGIVGIDQNGQKSDIMKSKGGDSFFEQRVLRKLAEIENKVKSIEPVKPPKEKKNPSDSAVSSKSATEEPIIERMKALKKLEDAGLISKEEAAAKRKEILKNL